MWSRFRFELWWTVAATIVALVAAFVPLVNVLGYEFAELFAIFATISVAAIAIKRLGDGTVDLRRDGVGEAATRLVGRSLLPLVPPPLLMLLNAVRVPNCDVPIGIALFLLLTIATVPVVVAIVMLLAAIFKRTAWRVVGYVLIILGSAASSVLHVLTQPPIYAYHPTIGFFSGSIYDEALELPYGLLPFRLMCLAFVVVVLAGLEIALRRRSRRSIWAPLLILVVAATVWSTIYHQRFEFRIEADREDIAEALGGVVESEHFIIHYALDNPRIAQHIDAVVADHEFRYAQLRDFFGVEPETPLRSFLYSNSNQKERYMGAGRTLIAKPWLGEMHLTYSGVGAGHLTHEMAHLFSAAFGSGPLRLAGGQLFSIDMGLVEGAAEAAAWDGVDLTLHGWSAALYEIDLAPDLVGSVGAAGFWTSYSRKVYTLMGSLCRWLIDEYGRDRFTAVYASGDFEATYNRPLADLIGDWREFLSALPLQPIELEQARFYYDRPTIFAKRCARSLAARARRGRSLASGGRYDNAVECFESVVRDDPHNTAYVLDLARYQRQAGAFDDAQSNAVSVAEREGAGRIRRARAQELLGDIAWSRGDLDGAAGIYERVADEPLGQDDLRRVTVKAWATREPAIADAVFSLFLAAPAPHRDAVTLLMAERAVEFESVTLNYLLALRLYEARDFERSLRYLDEVVPRLRARSAAESDRGLDAILRRAQLRRGQALFFLDRFTEARAAFIEMTIEADLRVDGRAAEALNWALRCDWSIDRE